MKNSPEKQHDLLDAPLKSPPENRVKAKQYFPLIIMWLGLVFSLLAGTLLEFKVLLGGIGVLAATVLAFVRWPYSLTIQILVLLLAICGLIHYSPLRFFLGFHDALGINIFPACTLLILVWTNPDSFKKLFQQFFLPSKRTTQSLRENKISGFKKRFRNHSIEDLTSTATNEQLTAEAREAAKRLLLEKTTTNPGLDD